LWGGRHKGSLFDPDGNPGLKIAWGMGIASNNKAKTLAALQGINLLLDHNITIIGDLTHIICSLLFG
jgi:hypothetical protein